MSKMEFKVKTETEALEKIANAPLEHHWGCDQILIDGCHFAMSDVQDYAKATLKNQPQLTIPKSIADELDFIYENHFDFNDDVSWVIANIDFLPTDEDYYTFDEWINQSVDNHNLALAYLAGKALGVDLVKVVEG